MLNRIEARNFKSFKHLDYKCAKLNLLTGLNGAGKSSFVQLMLMLRELAKTICNPRVEIDLRDTGVARTFSDIKYCYSPKGEPMGFSVEFTGWKSMGKYGMETSSKQKKASRIITESGKSPHHVLVWQEDVLRAFRQHERDFEESMKLLKQGDQQGFDDARELSDSKMESVRKRIMRAEKMRLAGYESVWWGVRFIEAFRAKPKEVHEGRWGSRYAMRLHSFSVADEERFDPEGGDIAEFLYKVGKEFALLDVNPMLHPQGERKDHFLGGEESTLLAQVNAWLGEISPGSKFLVDCVEVGDQDAYIVKIGFGEDCEGGKFKPQNVGLGISYILPVLGTILTAWPTSIIIIENPEAHIHPKGQAKLGELIARAAAYGVQVFVETHSDHVINGVRVAVRDGILKPEDVNIAFFERKEHLKDDAKDSDDTEIYSEIRNIKVDVNGSLSEYPEDFLDEWNNQLLELM